MGVFTLIGIAFSVIKVIWTIYQMIKTAKQADPTFNDKNFISRLREAIQFYRENHSLAKLQGLHDELKQTCEGAACPADTKE